MRKFFVLFAVLSLVLTVAADAQNPPKWEIFGGYSFLRIDDEGLQKSPGFATLFGSSATLKKNYSGASGEVQYNLNRLIGMTADLSYHHGTPITIPGTSTPSATSFTYLFGPTIYHQASHARPYLHFLFGGNRVSIGSAPGFSGISDSGFSFALGGGLDLKLSQHIAVRVGQADWLYTKHNACQLAGLSPINCASTFVAEGFPQHLTEAHQNNFRFATGIVFNFGER